MNSDKEVILFAVAWCIAVLFMAIFLGSLLSNAQISHPLVGAPYDWYPQDQTEQR